MRIRNHAVIPFVLLILAAAGCNHGKSYKYLTADEVAKGTRTAGNAKADPAEVLAENDILNYRIRYPKRWLTPEQVGVLQQLLKSPSWYVRGEAIARLGGPVTDSDRAIVFRLVEPMMQDPDSHVRQFAKNVLTRAHDPNVSR